MIFSSEGAAVSGIQFDLEYDATAMSMALTLGDSLRQSGKSMYTSDLASDRKRILIAGLNQNRIPDGALLNLFVNLRDQAPNASFQINISSAVATSPGGVQTALRGVAGALTVNPSTPMMRLRPGGVLSAASLLAGSVAPGEIISLIGSGIGPAFGQQSPLFPTTMLSGIRVRFDQSAAPLLYVAPSQINAIVPYEVSTRAITAIKITSQEQVIATASLAWVALALRSSQRTRAVTVEGDLESGLHRELLGESGGERVCNSAVRNGRRPN